MVQACAILFIAFTSSPFITFYFLNQFIINELDN